MNEQAKSNPIDLLLIKYDTIEHAQKKLSSGSDKLKRLKVRVENSNSPLNKYGAARLAAFEREYELLSEKFRRSEETKKKLWDNLFEGAGASMVIFSWIPQMTIGKNTNKLKLVIGSVTGFFAAARVATK